MKLVSMSLLLAAMTATALSAHAADKPLIACMVLYMVTSMVLLNVFRQ